MLEDYTCEGCACCIEREESKGRWKALTYIFLVAVVVGLSCGAVSTVMLLWWLQ
jgi:hypothetical protein